MKNAISSTRTRCVAPQLRGFTLLELLVTLAVALILISIATPAWTALVSASRLSSTADLLQTGYRMARTEAVKSSATTILQPVSGSDWNSGWVVMITKLDGSQEIVWRSGALPSGIGVTPDIRKPVRIAGTGALKTSVSGAQGPTRFTLSAPGSSMCLNLLVSGQSYLADGGC